MPLLRGVGCRWRRPRLAHLLLRARLLACSILLLLCPPPNLLVEQLAKLAAVQAHQLLQRRAHAHPGPVEHRVYCRQLSRGGQLHGCRPSRRRAAAAALTRLLLLLLLRGSSRPGICRLCMARVPLGVVAPVLRCCLLVLLRRQLARLQLLKVPLNQQL